MSRKDIAIIYHSGSGSTRTISEILKEKLSQSNELNELSGSNGADIFPISLDFDYSQLSDYRFIVFGFPTYKCEPSTSMKEFVDRMPRFDSPKNAYIFTTCGLYTGNAIRILAKRLKDKNVVVRGYMQIRGPASDGALLFPPSINFIYSYEKGVSGKIDNAVSEIRQGSNGSSGGQKIPPYKLYVPINDLFMYFGERSYKRYRDALIVEEDRCINCNNCVRECIRGSWSEGETMPSFDPSNCELCLHCVHNCPERAIIFSEKMKDRQRLNRKFYRGLKEKLLS